MCKKGSSVYINIAVLLLFISMIVGGCVLPAPPATAAPDQTIETEYVGRVIDVETQQPIAKAKITLDLEGVPPIVFTDSEGVYRFTVKIEAEIVGRVRVDAQGYETYTRNITLSPAVKTIEDIRLIRLQSPTATEPIVPTDAPIPSAMPTKATLLPTPTSTIDAAVNQEDTGWQGQYFNNNQFQQPATFTRTDPEISFDWKDSNPAPNIPVDNFSIRWTRCLTLEERYYIFTVRADDGAKVFVDDIFVLDTYYINQEYERQFAVSAGRHCIKIEYREGGQSALIYFNFRPGEASTIADESVAWKGEYFSNDSFKEPAAFLRNDPAPIFDWKDGNPAPNVPVDNFSVRWSRCFDLEDRYYVFTIRGDDQVKVFVDDLFVLDTYYINQEYQRQFAVTGGQHCIRIEYREGGQTASVYFDFQPGDPFTLADANVAWQAQYFSNNSFQAPAVFTRNDPAPIFDWKDGNPAPNVPVDNFSVRWSKCVSMEGREYTFTVRADDYARVLVDDILVVETYYVNQDYVKAFVVAAGQHCIKVEYREGGQFASIYFGFK